MAILPGSHHTMAHDYPEEQLKRQTSGLTRQMLLLHSSFDDVITNHNSKQYPQHSTPSKLHRPLRASGPGPSKMAAEDLAAPELPVDAHKKDSLDSSMSELDRFDGRNCWTMSSMSPCQGKLDLSEAASPITVSSGYESDKDVMPMREEDIDNLLYGDGQSPNCLETSKDSKDSGYVIQADDMYEQKYALNTYEDPSHMVGRVETSTPKKTQQKVCQQTVANSTNTDNTQIQSAKEGGVSCAHNKRKLSYVRRSMKEIIADLGTMQICENESVARVPSPTQISDYPHQTLVENTLTKPVVAAASSSNCGTYPKDTLKPCASNSSFVHHPSSAFEPVTPEHHQYNDSSKDSCIDLEYTGSSPSTTYPSPNINSCSCSDSAFASYDARDLAGSQYDLWSNHSQCQLDRFVPTPEVIEETEEPVYEIIEDDFLPDVPPPPVPIFSPARFDMNGTYLKPLEENVYDTISVCSRVMSPRPPALPVRNYSVSKRLNRRRGSSKRPGSEKTIHIDDVVKPTDIVDMNAYHIYTVADVLESFERLAGHLPKAKDNTYSNLSKHKKDTSGASKCQNNSVNITDEQSSDDSQPVVSHQIPKQCSRANSMASRPLPSRPSSDDTHPFLTLPPTHCQRLSKPVLSCHRDLLQTGSRYSAALDAEVSQYTWRDQPTNFVSESCAQSNTNLWQALNKQLAGLQGTLV